MPEKVQIQNDTPFLKGGGEMAELIKNFDWEKTSLGSIDNWPLTLRNTLGIILHSAFPQFLFWGKDLISFYNDPFRPSLGSEGKHPAIGKKAQDIWPEIWEFIGPLIEKVMTTGEAAFFEDQLVPFFRNGKIEDIYWTFSYSPAYGDDGNIAGVFVTCTETTEKIITHKELIESKDQLEFAIEATELGSFDYNPETNKFSANERLKLWFGLPPNVDVELTSAINAIAEKDREKVQAAIQQVLQFSSGGKYDIEYTIIHPITKKETIVHAKGKAWFNENKVAYRFNGTLQDVTEQVLERQNKEDALSQLSITTKHYQLALEAGQLGSYELDLEFGSIKCTAQCKINFGQNSEDNLTYSDFSNMVLEEDREAIRNALAYSIKNNTIYDVTYRIKTKSGELRWIHASALPVYNEQKVAIRMAGVTANITEKHTAALKIENTLKELERSEQKLNIIIDASQLGVFELDVKRKEIIFSKRYLEILGHFTPVILNLDDTRKQIHPDDVVIRDEAFKKAFETGVLYIKGRIVWLDKSIHWIESRGNVFFDSNNEPLKIIGTVRDITEEKRQQQILLEFANELEKQVNERTDEIKRKNNVLENMNNELQSFAYVASHDLQEPLRKIQTFATRILEKEQENFSELGINYFNRIQKSATRMQTLIEDLLSYSRTNSTDQTFRITDLNEIVKSVRDDFKETLEEKNAIITADNLHAVNIIPFQFRQILHNLISNAIKFSSKDRQLKIAINSRVLQNTEIKEIELPDNNKQSYCHLSISDNGIGFDQRYNEKVFEIFQRLHGKEEYSGTGIGLAIVKKIVENHNGLISVTSRIDEGTTFNIYFPN